MRKEPSVDALAKKLQISKSTVSKVLRHCEGVDTTARNKILGEAQNSGYRAEGSYDLCCILPSVPRYFWKTAMAGITGGAELFDEPPKISLYTHSIERMKVRALLIAVQPNGQIVERLEALAKSRLVILLSEFFEAQNCFYIGSYSKAEGEAMAALCVERYPQFRPLVLRFVENSNAEQRFKGFCDAYLANGAPGGEPTVIRLENRFYLENRSDVPARLASVLSKTVEPDCRYCVYCTMGDVQSPLAVLKAGLSDRIVCLGHDCRSVSTLYGDYNAVCSQDVYAQGFTAVQAAKRFLQYAEYPSQKYNYIPFHIDFPPSGRP